MNGFRVMHVRSLGTVTALLMCVCVLNVCAARGQEDSAGQDAAGEKRVEESTDASEAKTEASPSWAPDARWYEVIIPKFHNGDPSNDRPGTLPWSVEWPTFDGPREAPNEESARSEWFTAAMTPCLGKVYGGDLKGLEQRLPYLKELGVNTLYIGSVFHQTVEGTSAPPDLRHIDDTIGVKGSLADLTGESADPQTWQFSSSDRLFLDIVKRAHKEGFRVVIHGRFAALGALRDTYVEEDRYILAVTRRWMDPNGDGDPSDGVDGWLLDSNSRRSDEFWDVWRKQVRKINPSAIVVWQLGVSSGVQRYGALDVAVDFAATQHIFDFFGPGGGGVGDDAPAAGADRRRGPGGLQSLLGSSEGRETASRRLGDLTSWRSVMGPRLLSSLDVRSPAAGEGGPWSARAKPSAEAYARWRLATVLQHFYPGAPVTLYGDEVGMHGGPTVVNAERPMWWNDLSDPKTKSPDYRGDSFALVQWLHQLREKYAPLRRGDLRPVLMDEGRKILSFARSLPGDEVILVMNYGSEKQLVNLRAGRPGQLVAVLSPQLDPDASRRGAKRAPAKSLQVRHTPLQVGGSRQFVNDEGTIRVWVNPMSVRVVLLSDE